MDNPEQNHSKGPNLCPIGCVSTLLSNIRRIKKFEKQEIEKREAEETLLYYRGQSNACWKLDPSVMRDTKHRDNEGKMLGDLMTRQPDEFSRYASALDRWMLAQHHGLYTRFLDISTNPLVGLFYACNDDDSMGAEGSLYVFTTTRDRVKPYDSDAVSIVANFARLRRCEQNAILQTTKDFLTTWEPKAFVDHDQCRCIMHRTDGKDIKKVRYYVEHLKSLRRNNEDAGRYFDMGRLQTFIEQEKPYFVKDLIDPRDLFRIFIVQPRRLFPRLRAQSGAFLVSAHHKRFDFEYEANETPPHGACSVADREIKEQRDRNTQYRPNDHDVPYNYYRMTVKAGCKGIDSGRTEVSEHLERDSVPGAGRIREGDPQRLREPSGRPTRG